MREYVRRILSLACALCLLLSLGVTSALAVEETNPDPNTTQTGDASTPPQAQEPEEPSQTLPPVPVNPEEPTPDPEPQPTVKVIPLDMVGHWAEGALLWAWDGGILTGYEDGTLRPDAPLSEAQVVTIVSRLLKPQGGEENARSEDWFALDLARAEYLGLPAQNENPAGTHLPRSFAFSMLAEAFGLLDLSSEAQAGFPFTDCEDLSGEARQVLAALAYSGCIRGYEGLAYPDKALTRAEFVTILHRVIPEAMTGAELQEASPTGGVLVSGEDIVLKDKTFTRPLFFDCRVKSLTLENVKAPLLVFRSQETDELTLKGKTEIGRLVLAGGTQGEKTTWSLNPTLNVKIGTLAIGDRSGNRALAPYAPGGSSFVSVSGNVKRVELQGDQHILTVHTDLEELVLAGRNGEITLGKAVKAKTIRLCPHANFTLVTVPGPVENLVVNGSHNGITADGKVQNLTSQGGGGSWVEGKGSAQTLTLYTSLNDIRIPAAQTVDHIDYGIQKATMAISAPEILPAGEALTATVTIQNPEEKYCYGVWLVNGQEVAWEMLTVTPEGVASTLTHPFTYTKDMALTATLEFKLYYKNASEYRTEEQKAEKTITLENYGEDYYKRYDEAVVLQTVTTGYKGNYTLAWAEQNDYDQLTKEIWVNAKGHKSKTDYLIWINIACQRVNIFTGSQGNWSLLRSHIVGTGARGTDTPVGVYTVGTRSERGWVTPTYIVRPVVRFKEGSGLAFHSRIYNTSFTRITDASIGFPVSHGCIRMYDEDVQWIYDNIPQGTTVVVY